MMDRSTVYTWQACTWKDLVLLTFVVYNKVHDTNVFYHHNISFGLGEMLQVQGTIFRFPRNGSSVVEVVDSTASSHSGDT